MADQKEELPTMDLFTEDSLFDQLEDEEETGADGADDDDENDESSEDESSDDSKEDDDDSSQEDDEDEDEPEKKPVQKKGKASKKESESDDTEGENESFWSDVEKLTGRAVDVEYGDADPESPEGAAVREDALIQQAINDHLDYLQKIYPREFRALEHASNGGSMEDLYNPAEPDYSKIEFKEDDEDAQRGFMNSYYQKKGFSQAKAKRMTEADEDSDEGLHSAAKEALKELSSDQEKARNKAIEDQKAADKASKQQDMRMIGSVEEVVQAGKLNKFTVPVKEREQFHQHVLTKIQRNPNGGYMFVQQVEPNKLEAQLQEMYFAFKKGDLSTIIQREVKTEGARKLKRTAEKSSTKKIGSSSGSKKSYSKNLPTMDEHTE